MTFNLRVFDPTCKELPIIENDGRWNTEIKFDLQEAMLLELSETISDALIEGGNYAADSINRIRIIPPTFGEASDIIMATSAWKKIDQILSKRSYETSRFTRISLYKTLFDKRAFKKLTKNKIRRTLSK